METAAPDVWVRPIGHTVPDVDAAVEWYSDLLGFSVVAPPETISARSGHFADLFAVVVGEFGPVRLAHLVAAGGTGFGLFEYGPSVGSATPREPTGDEDWLGQPGIHPFAVPPPDLEAIVERQAERGGERHASVWRVDPDRDGELVYVRVRGEFPRGVRPRARRLLRGQRSARVVG